MTFHVSTLTQAPPLDDTSAESSYLAWCQRECLLLVGRAPNASRGEPGRSSTRAQSACRLVPFSPSLLRKILLSSTPPSHRILRALCELVAATFSTCNQDNCSYALPMDCRTRAQNAVAGNIISRSETISGHMESSSRSLG
jgi:hypothetical protein